MVQAKEYRSAFALFYHRLDSTLYHQLGAYQLVIELLNGFFIQEDNLISMVIAAKDGKER
jgi:hypothetical protein